MFENLFKQSETDKNEKTEGMEKKIEDETKEPVEKENDKTNDFNKKVNKCYQYALMGVIGSTIALTDICDNWGKLPANYEISEVTGTYIEMLSDREKRKKEQEEEEAFQAKVENSRDFK